MKMFALSFLAAAGVSAAAPAADRVALRLDTSEADSVLAILDERSAGKPVSDASWRRLFECEPYVRLKRREESFHAGFSDDDFKKYVLSEDLARRRAELESALSKWKAADLNAAARRALAYLPDQAVIRAAVYPVIKPKSNSFVVETATNPAIFLFLDPAVAPAKFENTVAHELHHIGFASVTEGEKAASGPPRLAAAREWLGAFGEGFAMLAAAGSPDMHPHAASPAKDRERWDRDMANFNRDLKALEAFFLGALDGKLDSREKIDAAGIKFFGEQGPWYTVGYEMAVVVERREGRAALIACMADPRKLLAAYDRDAAELNSKSGKKLALWSPELLEKLEAR